MPEVMAIEDSRRFPLGEDHILGYLRSREHIGMVAEHGDKVAGFMVYELRKYSIGIKDFVVHPACRRSGVGGQMIAKLIGKLSAHRRVTIDAAVRESELDFLLFLRSCGFLATGISCGHFSDTGEDAIRMEYEVEP